VHCFDLRVPYSCVAAASNTTEDRRMLDMNSCCDVSSSCVIVDKRFIYTSNYQMNNSWYQLIVKVARDCPLTNFMLVI
jgi:hypothetical protein